MHRAARPDEARDSLRNRIGFLDRAAEVVHHTCHAIEIARDDETLEVVDRVLQPVVAFLRCCAFAESHVVRHDDAMDRTPCADRMAQQITPRGCAMQARDGRVLGPEDTVVLPPPD